MRVFSAQVGSPWPPEPIAPAGTCGWPSATSLRWRRCWQQPRRQRCSSEGRQKGCRRISSRKFTSSLPGELCGSGPLQWQTNSLFVFVARLSSERLFYPVIHRSFLSLTQSSDICRRVPTPIQPVANLFDTWQLFLRQLG